MIHATILATLATLALVASTPVTLVVDETYTLVYLKTGVHAEAVPTADRERLSAGHYANVERLSEAGLLLVAGPYGDSPGEGIRGIYIFDTRTLEEGLALATSDPAIEAGVFDIEAVTWTSPSPLRAMTSIKRSMKAREESKGRAYVLVTSLDERAEELLAPHVAVGLVLIHGHSGEAAEGEFMAILDVAEKEEARALLEVEGADDVVAWSYYSWYSSNSLARLPRAAASTFIVEAIEEEASLAVFAPAFQFWVRVFGVPIVATKSTPEAKVLHAAEVLAQYLDNDEDGVVDDERVARFLRAEGAFLAMAATNREFDSLALDFEAVDRAGFRIGQDLYGAEALPAGPPHAPGPGRFDATLEEVWHLVSNGYAAVYPAGFGIETASRLTAAMDRARGGRFESIPERYPDEAWYSYDDETCDYACMAMEYFYWALTSSLGAQDYAGRASEVASEWRLTTPAKLREVDSEVHALLTDSAFHLPRVLPDGGYRR